MRAKLFFTLFFIFSCSTTTHEVPTPLFSKKQLWDKGAMVSAANPHAVDAAVDSCLPGSRMAQRAAGPGCRLPAGNGGLQDRHPPGPGPDSRDKLVNLVT